MVSRASRLATLRGVILLAMLLPLEHALRLERLLGPAAIAEAKQRRRTPRARRRLAAQLFHQAQQLMAEGRYREAILAFNRSFGLAPAPETLLGLAQCHELSGQLDQALRLYQRILGKPGKLNQSMLRKRLAAVKQLIEAHGGPTKPPTNPPASKPASRPSVDNTDVSEDITGGGDVTTDVGTAPEEDQASAASPLEVSGLLSGWIRAALDVDMAHSRADGPTDILEDSLELRHRMLLRLNVRYGARYQAFASALVDHVLREKPPEGNDAFALFNGRSVHSELDASVIEAYLALSVWRLDIRGGMLRVPWGKSDVSSPNDVINPRDGRNVGREELEILRLPVLAVETELSLGPFTAELIWQPVFRPDKLVLYGTDWGLIRPSSPAPVRGLARFIQNHHDETLTEAVQQLLMQTALPPSDPRSSSIGLRLGLRVRGMDFSLYYHYGWDVSPFVEMDPRIMGELAKIDWSTATLQTMSPLLTLVDSGVPLYRATFIRRHHVGADAVATLGPFTLRAEVGFDNKRVFYDPQLRGYLEPAVAANVGFDYSKSLYQNISLDVSYIHVAGGPEELLYYNRDYACVGGIIRWGILRGNLVGEVRGMIGIAPWTYVVRPQITYKITQSWWVSAGVMVLGGNERSIGGLFDRDDLIFFEGTFNL